MSEYEILPTTWTDAVVALQAERARATQLEAKLAAARAEIDRAERVRLQLWDKLDATRAHIAELEKAVAAALGPGVG